MLQRGPGKDLDERGQEMLTEVIGAASEIDRILGAFVRMADSTEPPSHPSTTTLSLVVRGACVEVAPRFESEGGKIEVRGEPGEQAAPSCLRLVLIELLENAVKFRDVAPPVATIETFADESESRVVVVVVTDNGIGIEPQYFEQIFLPFKRLHTRQQYPGFGLGLTTARNLIEVAGGRLVARQIAPGACFAVTLPIG